MEKNRIGELQNQKTQNIIFFLIVGFNLIMLFFIVLSPVVSVKGAETDSIYTIQRSMLNPQWMFTDPENLPYAITQYTPLYHIICTHLCNLLSLTPGEDVITIYKISRLLSTLAAMVAGYFIFLLAFDLSGKKKWSVWISALSIICTTPWYFTVRPDAFMACFFFGSIYFFIKSYTTDQYWQSLLLAGLLAALAFFSKQNGLVISLIIGSYLLITLKIKNLFLYTGGFLLGCFIFYLLIIPFSNEYFFINIIQGINNGINLKGALLTPYYNATTQFGMIIIITLILLLLLLKNYFKNLSHQFKFLIYCFLLLFPFSIITALKPGSDINYFNEVVAIALIILLLIYHLLSKLFKELKSKVFVTFLFLLLLAFTAEISLTNFIRYGTRNILRFGDKEYVYNYDLIDFIKNEKLESGDHFYFMSEDPSLNNFFPEHCIFPNYTVAYLWYHENISDYASLKQAVADGTIRYIIVKGDLMASIFDVDTTPYYKLYKTIGKYYIYAHKTNFP